MEFIIRDELGEIIDIDKDYVRYRILKRDPSFYKYMIDAEEVVINRDIVTIINKNYNEDSVTIAVGNIQGDYEVYKFLKKHSKEMMSLINRYDI